ncbi:enoyl-CoA hydratase/isomerase family protein [Congregibacter litoralis]|uniref:Enoyl-CoA hydratase/carnithine racemase n=1 Tax=Congregibacter litoralis KT71 TaxID=314285 RepID=A4A3Z5_9GAMM|nr:enoyl-CoA hydratase/isomerase family protein [Congregibacter litoralis]EAQ99418.1 Enoyl-CoA hydratase/carnithine racemase [Congregibacter litoralis KT71]
MSQETYETLLIERHGPVARLVMNRPEKLNTFSTTLRREMMTAVNALNGDPELRVIVLAGAGRAFSAGADLQDSAGGDPEHRGQETEHMLKSEYKPSILGITESTKLWIAEVSGPAAGIGSAYMMACDLVVMAKGSYLYQAFAAIGLIPDGGATWQLLRALGRKRAFEVIVGGERIYAEQCLEWGLCNRVVEEGDETQAALDWASTLAKKAPLAVQFSKKAIAMAADLNFGEMISQEAAMQNICIASDDSAEGVTAFFEKRAPVFKGR